MARKKVQVKAIRGKRLNELLERKKISQKDFAEKIYISQQTISKIINGHSRLTDDVANVIIRTFPDVRKSYLMGDDDFGLTQEDVNIHELTKSQNEADVLYTSICALAKLSNYSIECNGASSNNAVDVISSLKQRYTVTNKKRSAKLSIQEMNTLENDIAYYVEFRLNKILENGNK